MSLYGCVSLWAIFGGEQGPHLLPPVHLLHLIKAAPSLSPGSQTPWTCLGRPLSGGDNHFPINTKDTQLGHQPGCNTPRRTSEEPWHRPGDFSDKPTNSQLVSFSSEDNHRFDSSDTHHAVSPAQLHRLRIRVLRTRFQESGEVRDHHQAAVGCQRQREEEDAGFEHGLWPLT